MKALIIGGGGNKGASGSAKIAKINEEFHIGAGVSTGALMLVPVLLNEHKLLKDTYTNVDSNEVWDYSPFNKKGRIKVWYLIYRILRGKPTLGDSEALRNTLTRVYNENHLWDKLKQSGKKAYVGVYNDTIETFEMICSDDVSEEDWIDFTWASACQPPAMSIMEKWGNQYLDGGVTEVVPWERLIKDNYVTDVTVVAHRPKNLPLTVKGSIKNLIHNGCRLILGMRKEITNNDLNMGKAICEAKEVKYKIYYATQGYGENDLVFNKDRMKEWYNVSYSEEINESNYESNIK